MRSISKHMVGFLKLIFQRTGSESLPPINWGCLYLGRRILEHREGIEPSNTGFADQRVSHFATGALAAGFRRKATQPSKLI